MEREVKFKVVATNLADHEVTIFDSSDYKMCEDFAVAYMGDYKEISIKKVFVRPYGAPVTEPRPGSEL